MVMTRYEQLAQQIREQIQNRVWRAGDKLPSLRESGKRAGLSLMTVVQSYQLLESGDGSSPGRSRATTWRRARSRCPSLRAARSCC